MRDSIEKDRLSLFVPNLSRSWHYWQGHFWSIFLIRKDQDFHDSDCLGKRRWVIRRIFRGSYQSGFRTWWEAARGRRTRMGAKGAFNRMGTISLGRNRKNCQKSHEEPWIMGMFFFLSRNVRTVFNGLKGLGWKPMDESPLRLKRLMTWNMPLRTELAQFSPFVATANLGMKQVAFTSSALVLGTKGWWSSVQSSMEQSSQ